MKKFVFSFVSVLALFLVTFLFSDIFSEVNMNNAYAMETNYTQISNTSLYWSVDNGTLTINGTGQIPDYYKITSPGTTLVLTTPWESQNNLITKIVIENGVTGIGGYAFNSLSKVTEISLSKTVESIGYYSFPSKVSSFSVNADNPYLVSENGVLFNSSKNQLIKYNSGSNNTEYVIPYGVTDIMPYAFTDDKALSSIIIPNSVKIIHENAFGNCDSLLEIIIPGSVESIMYGAFNECDNLCSAELLNGVKTIGSGAFSECNNLKKVELPDSITEINAYAFEWCPLEKIRIPGSVKTIGAYAFNGCMRLHDVKICDGVENIAQYAFRCCYQLSNIGLPKSIRSIEEGAFSFCDQLWFISFLGKPEFIAEDAFYSVSAKVYVPDSWTEDMKKNYTYNSSSLNYYSLNKDNSIPNSELYWKFDDQGTLTISGFGEMPHFSIYFELNGFSEYLHPLSIKDEFIPWCSLRHHIKKAVISEGVTEVGEMAFLWCSELERVLLADSVDTISSEAFCYCSELKYINIPYSLKTISQDAFYDCKELKGINFPSQTVISGDETFMGCDALDHIHICDGMDISNYAGKYGLPSDVKKYYYLNKNNCCNYSSCPLFEDVSAYDVLAMTDSLRIQYVNSFTSHMDNSDSIILDDIKLLAIEMILDKDYQ